MKIKINYHVIRKEKEISDWKMSGRLPGGDDV